MDIEQRLRRLEDEAEIHRLAARFSDAVNERDVVAFAATWAREGAVWTIGPPLESRAEGLGPIVGMIERLYGLERYFMQLTHSGVVTLDGDRATARFAIREHGRGESSYYENLAVYDDELIREAGIWRFASRTYSYRFLNQEPFADDVFPVASPAGQGA